MKKINRNILKSKKIIKEEKNKIKLEKKNLRIKKRNSMKKTKFGKFLGKIFSIFSNKKNSYSFSEVFTITLFSIVLGIFACISIFTVFTGGRNYIKLSRELSKFYDVYETLIDNYNGDIDKEELVDSAIDGMVSNMGDVYTSYADINETSEFDEMVKGVYEGIGCTIMQLPDSIKIAEVYDGGPSDKAGLEVGDLILSVDDKDALSLGVSKLSEYVKYEADKKITMIIMREEEKKEIILTRDEVEIPVVSTKIFDKSDKKIGYIKVSLFSSVAANQFEEKLKELEENGINSLVIDVRGNNGGYLSAVTDISSLFLSKGEKIYQIQKDNDKKIVKDKTSDKREYPIAILVNGNSASASEILAGVIKESYKGFVVGTKTFGKGTVQQVKKLSDGSMIKYTVENWLTPDGNWINGKGIEPTDVVALTEGYYENPKDENDEQLQKAIELVSK